MPHAIAGVASFGSVGVATIGMAVVGSRCVVVAAGACATVAVASVIGVLSVTPLPPNMFKMLAPATTMMIIGMTHCRCECGLLRGATPGGRLVAGVCGSGGMLGAADVAGFADGAVCGTGRDTGVGTGAGVGRMGVGGVGVSGTWIPVV